MPKIEIEFIPHAPPGSRTEQRPLVVEGKGIIMGIRFTFDNGRSVMVTHSSEGRPEIEVRSTDDNLAAFSTGGVNVINVRPISADERRDVN